MLQFLWWVVVMVAMAVMVRVSVAVSIVFRPAFAQHCEDNFNL